MTPLLWNIITKFEVRQWSISIRIEICRSFTAVRNHLSSPAYLKMRECFLKSVSVESFALEQTSVRLKTQLRQATRFTAGRWAHEKECASVRSSVTWSQQPFSLPPLQSTAITEYHGTPIENLILGQRCAFLGGYSTGIWVGGFGWSHRSRFSGHNTLCSSPTKMWFGVQQPFVGEGHKVLRPLKQPTGD